MTGRDARRFSPVGFAVALVTIGAGTAVGLAAVPVVGSYLGTLAGGFVTGLAVEDRPLAEAGVAGVLAGLGILVAGTLVGNGVVAALVALGSVDPGTLLVSAALSFAVGAFGAHFGDDLRDGLTAPLYESSHRPTTRESVGHRAAVESADSEPTERETDTATESPEVELEGPERDRD